MEKIQGSFTGYWIAALQREQSNYFLSRIFQRTTTAVAVNRMFVTIGPPKKEADEGLKYFIEKSFWVS